MQLQEILYTQGFGSRRQCTALVLRGAVAVGGRPCADPQEDFPDEGLHFTVDGVAWISRAKATILLNKPAGTECSHKPGQWPSVYALLPAPLRQRPVRGGVDGVQAVGRLDVDTTGLLLLTDDGQLLHRLGSPRHHVPKVYEALTAEALDARQVQMLLAGVVLADDPQPVRAAACEALDSHRLRITLTQGKYHQVRRMIGAVGNRVVGLQRTRYGPLELPAALAPGQFRWLDAAELAALHAACGR